MCKMLSIRNMIFYFNILSMHEYCIGQWVLKEPTAPEVKNGRSRLNLNMVLCGSSSTRTKLEKHLLLFLPRNKSKLDKLHRRVRRVLHVWCSLSVKEHDLHNFRCANDDITFCISNQQFLQERQHSQQSHCHTAPCSGSTLTSGADPMEYAHSPRSYVAFLPDGPMPCHSPKTCRWVR